MWILLVIALMMGMLVPVQTAANAMALLIGGVCGAISVFGNAWLIPIIGAGAFFMAFLLGQMGTGVVMESRGWLGAMRRQITFVQLVGIALMVAGVAMIRL